MQLDLFKDIPTWRPVKNHWGDFYHVMDAGGYGPSEATIERYGIPPFCTLDEADEFCKILNRNNILSAKYEFIN